MEPPLVTANIGFTGRRFRQRIGVALLVISLLLAVWFLFHPATAWPWRLLVFFPLAGAVTSLLEARRSTCIARAAAGTIEDESGGTTPQPACDRPSTRRAAARIVRDAVIIGLAGAAVLAAL